MPKGKKKGKYEHRRTEVAYSSDEDAGIDMTNDNYSETSGQSDLRSNHDDAENEIQEKLEEKVLEIIDALSARANAARAAALVALRNVLQRRYLAHLLSGQRATLAEHITKALRRGRDGEKKAAAAVAPLLALQIGEEGTEEFMAEVRPALAAAAVDKSASLDTRTECCSSLAVLCYMLEEDLSEVLEIMRMFETIFSGSYLKNEVEGADDFTENHMDMLVLIVSLETAHNSPWTELETDNSVIKAFGIGFLTLEQLDTYKGDGSVKVSGAAVEEGAWHAAALDGWALLLLLAEPQHARALLAERPPSFARLAELLDACSLEVRMAAGGALAIAHERVSGDEDEAEWPAEELVRPRLERLARDSHKYRAKRDRKLQRATFRDILRYFEEGSVSAERVRVGAWALSLESWGARGAYGALAAALGAGLSALAPHAAALRAALQLGPAAAEPAGPRPKLNKLQRHLQNSAACKARTVARNKSRDKRSAALAL